MPRENILTKGLGTVLNDGDRSHIRKFITALESSIPPIIAISDSQQSNSATDHKK